METRKRIAHVVTLKKRMSGAGKQQHGRKQQKKPTN